MPSLLFRDQETGHPIPSPRWRGSPENCASQFGDSCEYLLEEDFKLKGKKKVPKRFRNTGKRVMLEHHHLEGCHRGLAFACQLTCTAQALKQAREFTSLAAWETELRNVLHTWGLRVSPEHCYEAE